MCGRNSLFHPQPELEERFDATAYEPIRPQYNIASGEDLAVVRNDEPEAIDELEWGLLPGWADDPDDSPRPINARSETAAEKPVFRDAFEKRRCLVLSSGFYEWQEQAGGPKQPYRICLEDAERFAFAGLWERWERNGAEKQTVTILTTDANEQMEPIHDRMPVVLEPDEEDTWLAATDEDELDSVLGPYRGDDLRTYPISTAVNSPDNDSPEIIEPVDVGEQAGLNDF
jgi:putative SOS response-associated peptidase YedK